MLMKWTPALFGYLLRIYLSNLALLMSFLLSIVYLFDTVELMRRAGKRDDIGLGTVFQMGLLKLPDVGQVVVPFAILFSAMFTFWQLTKRNELVVARASGFSVWQFLAPIMAAAFLIGVLQITVVNPVGAILLGRFEQMENRYLKREKSLVTLFREGFWLRQAREGGHVILHAESIAPDTWTLQGVSALFFDENDTFRSRIDAERGTLNAGAWRLEDAVINAPPSPPERVDSYTIPTELTTSEIEESFASPDTLSFWRLPGFIRTLQATGFDATRLQIHFHNLLAQPFLLCALILLAASVSLRGPRFQGVVIMVVLGIFVGFSIFFLSSFLNALGASHQIPVLLAAWSPSLICFLCGTAVLLNLEDG